MALRGIDPYSASSGSWTRMMPPASLTALIPTDPSEPAPERTMAKSSPRCAASERKNKINRRALPARLLELSGRQMVIGREKLTIGRDDVDVARFKSNTAGDLRHRHSRASRKNAGQLALVLRIEMHDNNEGGVDILRETFEEHLQSVNASRGRSDADRRKSLAGFLRAPPSVARLVHRRSQTLRSDAPGSMGAAARPCELSFQLIGHLAGRPLIPLSPYSARMTPTILKVVLRNSDR